MMRAMNCWPLILSTANTRSACTAAARRSDGPRASNDGPSVWSGRMILCVSVETVRYAYRIPVER